MGIGDVLQPATSLFSGVIPKIMGYAWVLFPLVIIIGLTFVVVIIKLVKKKKLQWTHKLRIRRALHGGKLVKGSNDMLKLSEPIYINMRRFPLIKGAEVFELEKPLFGGYLFPQLEESSSDNEYSIILDIDNRIYTNKGEFFDKDKNSVNVSARHSEIDIGFSNLKVDYQNINRTSKLVEWGTIAKYALASIFVIAVMVVLLVGISKWGEAQGGKAELQQAEAMAMKNLADAMITMEAVVNTQKLEILPMMKEIYKTENIQGIINENYEENI